MMKKYIWLMLLVCVLSVGIGPKVLAQQEEKPISTEPIFLQLLLVELAKTHHCVFTLELAESDSLENVMTGILVQRVTEKSDLEQTLDRLRQTVPNFTYQINRANPQIVHIIDARLQEHSNYGLEAIVPYIEFQGRLEDLPTAIGKKGINISSPLLTSTSDALSVDLLTKVNIKASGLKVREILSNFINLKDRGKILWIAKTNLDANEDSYIQFVGASKKK